VKSPPLADLGTLERYRVPVGTRMSLLANIDARDNEGIPFSRAEAEALTALDLKEIRRLQEILYAQAGHALLVVLQGLDTSGKDGTIRKVFGRIPPLGITAISFKKPIPEELTHDFLWRIHRAAPPIGMIAVFNRSHYEDVLVARVHNLVEADRIEARYRQINDFERCLVENRVTIIKFFLHISKKEQKKRLRARLADPTKRWKFDPNDISERKYWNEYISAYELAMQRCNTVEAPWFIVPADRKWYRNAVVSRIVRRTLEAMDLRYPADPPGLGNIRI
jgi:PPK2 family polyphosphate:nucleotide phosphotransferase